MPDLKRLAFHLRPKQRRLGPEHETPAASVSYSVQRLPRLVSAECVLKSFIQPFPTTITLPHQKPVPGEELCRWKEARRFFSLLLSSSPYRSSFPPSGCRMRPPQPCKDTGARTTHSSLPGQPKRSMIWPKSPCNTSPSSSADGSTRSS